MFNESIIFFHHQNLKLCFTRAITFGEYTLSGGSFGLLFFQHFGFFEPMRKTRIKKDSPLDILQKRFASGEISKDEYFENKKILEEDIKSAGMTSH